MARPAGLGTGLRVTPDRAANELCAPQCAQSSASHTARCQRAAHNRCHLLDRQFEATAPNLKWGADFTYLWTHEGWLFRRAFATGVLRRMPTLHGQNLIYGKQMHRREPRDV